MFNWIKSCKEGEQYEYDQTIQFAAESVNIITSTIKSVDFDKKDLNTTSFNVRTHYEGFRDRDNSYKSKFDGYTCEQGLKLDVKEHTLIVTNKTIK